MAFMYKNIFIRVTKEIKDNLRADGVVTVIGEQVDVSYIELKLCLEISYISM